VSDGGKAGGLTDSNRIKSGVGLGGVPKILEPRETDYVTHLHAMKKHQEEIIEEKGMKGDNLSFKDHLDHTFSTWAEPNPCLLGPSANPVSQPRQPTRSASASSERFGSSNELDVRMEERRFTLGRCSSNDEATNPSRLEPSERKVRWCGIYRTKRSSPSPATDRVRRGSQNGGSDNEGSGSKGTNHRSHVEGSSKSGGKEVTNLTKVDSDNSNSESQSKRDTGKRSMLPSSVTKPLARLLSPLFSKQGSASQSSPGGEEEKEGESSHPKRPHSKFLCGMRGAREVNAEVKCLCGGFGKMKQSVDGEWSMEGGETWVMSLRSKISFQELLAQVSRPHNQQPGSSTGIAESESNTVQTPLVKYQFPNSSVLISVSTDADVQQMFWVWVQAGIKDTLKRRIFLMFPSYNSFASEASYEDATETWEVNPWGSVDEERQLSFETRVHPNVLQSTVFDDVFDDAVFDDADRCLTTRKSVSKPSRYIDLLCEYLCEIFNITSVTYL
jgi:hypothetical protein